MLMNIDMLTCRRVQVTNANKTEDTLASASRLQYDRTTIPLPTLGFHLPCLIIAHVNTPHRRAQATGATTNGD